MSFGMNLFMLAIGFVAGFLNTVAGGGSLLVVPILIFLGLPAIEANATNRLAVAVQSFSGLVGYKSQGVSNIRYGLFLSIFAVLGAIVGANIALCVNDHAFERLLSVVMIAVLFLIVWNPRKSCPIADKKHRALSALIFFFVGIYSGFLQSGVGFIVLAILSCVDGLDLVSGNSIKVTVIFMTMLPALVIFAHYGKMNWQYALVLSLGNIGGAWCGSVWAVKKGDIWIRRLLIVTIFAMAIKLSGVLNFLW